MVLCCCCCQQSKRKVDSVGSEPLITKGKIIATAEASANDDSSVSSIDSGYAETNKTYVDDTASGENIRGEWQSNNLGTCERTTNPKRGSLEEDLIIPKKSLKEQSNSSKGSDTAAAIVHNPMKKRVTFHDAPDD